LDSLFSAVIPLLGSVLIASMSGACLGALQLRSRFAEIPDGNVNRDAGSLWSWQRSIAMSLLAVSLNFGWAILYRAVGLESPWLFGCAGVMSWIIARHKTVTRLRKPVEVK